MEATIVKRRNNPRYMGDSIWINFGSSKDARVGYDATNDEWTVQSKDSGGAQTDRIQVKGNQDITQVALYNDDPGATGIQLDAFHESASPAVSDALFDLRIYGIDGNAAPAKVQYGGFQWTITNIGDGTEESQLDVGMMKAGAFTSLLKYKTGAFAFQEAVTISVPAATVLTLSAPNGVDLNSQANGGLLNIGASGNDFKATILDLVTNFIIDGAGNLMMRAAGEFQIIGEGNSGSRLLYIDSQRPAAATGIGISIRTYNASNAATPRLTLTSGVNTAVLTVASTTIALGGNNITMTGSIAATGARVTILYATNITSTNAVTVDSWSRSKENIFAYTKRALDIIQGIDVIGFNHLADRDPSGRIKLGIRAESVAEPLALVDHDYGHGLGVGPALDTMGLAALNTKAIQELNTEHETRFSSVEDRLSAVEAAERIVELETEVNRLRKLVEA